MRAEALRLPDLKLVSEPDEGHRARNVRVRLQGLGENDAAFRIDRKRLALAKERGRQFLALLRIGRIALDQRFDLREQRLAAGVQRRPPR